MSILKINSRTVPSPSGALLSVADVVYGGLRTADGALLTRAPKLKRTLTLSWKHMSAQEMNALWDALSLSTVTELQLTGFGTMNCLCPERTAAVLSATGNALSWTDVELRFEEK